MSAAALLAVGAAVCYGVSNFVGPRLARNLPLYPVLISGQVVAFAVSGLLVLTELDRGGPSLGEAGAAALAGVGNAIGLLAFYRAASVGPAVDRGAARLARRRRAGARGRGAGGGAGRAQARRRSRSR